MTSPLAAGVRPAHIVRFAGLAPTPWRNGGGITREIAVSTATDPEHGPLWRLSVADVSASGDFSTFPEVDRVLMLCRGSDMAVRVDEREHVLQPWDMIRFPGEAHTSATLLDGRTVDLNVMTRRGAATAVVSTRQVSARHLVEPVPASTVLLVAVDGQLGCRGKRTGATRLGEFDTVIIEEHTEAVEIFSTGRVVHVEVSLGP
jgi:environmental stress-induced protein Ves